MMWNDLSRISVDAGIITSIISEHSNDTRLGKDICSCNCVSACSARLHCLMPALSFDWTTRPKPLGHFLLFRILKYVYHSNLHLFPLSTRSSDWSWSVFNKARGHTLSDKVKLALEPPSTASYCIKRLNSQHRKRCPERMQGARLDEVSHRVRNLTRLCISFLTVTSWDKQSWTVRAALSGITGVWWTLIGSQPRHNLVRACCLHFC